MNINQHILYLKACVKNQTLPQAILTNSLLLAENFLTLIFGHNYQQHPDLYNLDQENPSTESIREIITKLQTTSMRGGYKVCFIKYADNLNLSAMQVLLKPLEEPVADTIFILKTQNKDNLLPTIRSRCIALEIQQNNNLGGSLDYNLDSLYYLITECLKVKLQVKINPKLKINKITQLDFGRIIKLLDLIQNLNKKIKISPYLNQDLLFKNFAYTWEDILHGS